MQHSRRLALGVALALTLAGAIAPGVGLAAGQPQHPVLAADSYVPWTPDVEPGTGTPPTKTD